MPTVFVSHSSQDAAFVERNIIPVLTSAGVEVWYSKTCIETAEEWERAIKRGLESSDWFLVIVSENAARSKWVRGETNWAFDNRGGRIIPVLIDKSNPRDLHFLIPDIQLVELTNDTDNGTERLASFVKRKLMEERPGSATTNLTRDSEGTWLLQSRDAIRARNRRDELDRLATLPETLGGSCSLAYACLVNAWNDGKLTLSASALRADLVRNLGASLSDQDWQETLAFIQDHGHKRSHFGFLLETPDKEKLAINYPSLAEHWSSAGESIKMLLGVDLVLREPRGDGEVNWCEWLATLSRSPVAVTRPDDPQSSLSPEQLFPEAEQEKLARDIRTLGFLPAEARGDLSKYLGERILTYRRALFGSGRCGPSDVLTTLYLGTLIYWDLLRIANAGTPDERQWAATARYERDDGFVLVGYLDIAEDFLQSSLSHAPPPGGGVEMAARLLAEIRTVRQDAKRRHSDDVR